MTQQFFLALIKNTLAGLLITALLASVTWAQQGQTQPVVQVQSVSDKDVAQNRDLDLLMSVLVEPKLSMQQRREAALSLLRKDLDLAVERLVAEFTKPKAPSNQQVIAQAITDFNNIPPKAFVAPLLASLQEEKTDLLDDVASALGRYQNDPQVTSQLVALAVDNGLNLRIRRGAIVSLGYHRNRDVVGVLINLLSAKNAAAVRIASVDSLSRITGNYQFKLNVQLWRTWWDSHRELDEVRWLSALIENFAHHTSQLAIENNQITRRLVETQRQLYLATPAPEQTEMLGGMMVMSELSMRLLAMDLIVQRLLDQQPIGETLKTGLIVALDDASSTIRAKSAQLIRDLNDPAGADAIAQRMDGESDAIVLRAYLLAMADMPREKAFGRAMRLLGDAELQNPAAGVLERAIADGLVTEYHKQALSRQLRQLTAGDETLLPKMIELLGRVATQDDWQRIAGWMDNKNDSVRIAAAEAWAASDRPLDELARRAESEVFLPILLRAAVKRGTKGATLIQIARYKPKAEQLLESWQQALQAMAARVSALDVVEADRVLSQHQGVQTIRERMLSAIIVKSNGHADVQLLLARAAVRLETSQAIQALADLGIVQSHQKTLSSENTDRLRWLTLRAATESSQQEKALQTIDEWFASLANLQDKQALADRLLEYQVARINKAIAMRKVELATLMLTQTKMRIQEYLSDSAKQKISSLEVNIAELAVVVAKEQAKATESKEKTKPTKP